MTLTKRVCWSQGSSCSKEVVHTRDTLTVAWQPIMGTTWLTTDGRDPALLRATRTTKKPAAKKMSSIERERVKKATWPTLDWKGELFHLYFFQVYHRFSSRTETFHFVHDAVQSTTDFLLCSDLEKLHIPSTLPS